MEDLALYRRKFFGAILFRTISEISSLFSGFRGLVIQSLQFLLPLPVWKGPCSQLVAGFVRQCEGGDSLRGVLSTWVPLYSHIRTLVRGKDATRLYRTLVRYGQLVLSILLKNPATDGPTFGTKKW